MKRMGWLIVAGMSCAGFSHAQVNLALNGDFDKTTAPWYGQKLEIKGDLEKLVGAPEMIAHETKDTPDKSPGALKVTIKKDSNHQYRSHNSGAICKLTGVIPAEKPARVTFFAKSRSGDKVLSVHRLWGGGSDTTLIGEKWEKHELTLRSAHDTDGFVFSLVPQSSTGIQELTDGAFLLDNVSVVVLEQQ
jgi:hypothetical protein